MKLPYRVENGYAVTTLCREKLWGSFQVPQELDGLPVIEIGPHTFLGQRELTEVIIPEGIQRIGYEAFCGCEKLEHIDAPATIREVGANAIGGTSWERCLPAGFGYMGGYLYEYHGLTEDGILKLPAGTLGFAGTPLSRCGGIRELLLPEGFQRLGPGCLAACIHLQAISLPASLEELGREALADCSQLRRFETDAPLQHVGENCFKGCRSLDTLLIPRMPMEGYQGSSMRVKCIAAVSFLTHADRFPTAARASYEAFVAEHTAKVSEYAVRLQNMEALIRCLDTGRLDRGQVEPLLSLAQRLQANEMVSRFLNYQHTRLGGGGMDFFDRLGDI